MVDNCNINNYHNGSMLLNNRVYKDIIVTIMISILVIINRFYQSSFYGFSYNLMNYWFNDLVGSIAFVCIVDIVSIIFINKKIEKFSCICLLMLFAGLCWEFIMPIFIKSTSDWIDMCMYFLGGLIYHLLFNL